MRAVGVGLMILGACCFAGCIAILGGCEPGAEYWPPQRVKVVERVVVERTMDPDTYLYAVGALTVQ